MYAKPEAWYALMEKLGNMVVTYVKAQINAGASAIQIFDSWVGALNVEDYRLFIKPVMNRIFLSWRMKMFLSLCMESGRVIWRLNGMIFP